MIPIPILACVLLEQHRNLSQAITSQSLSHEILLAKPAYEEHNLFDSVSRVLS
jgi:hypothetical protein